MSLLDSIIELMLSPKLDQAAICELETILAAYIDTVERILGAPQGSLNVFEPGAFDAWLVELQPEAASK